MRVMVVWPDCIIWLFCARLASIRFMPGLWQRLVPTPPAKIDLSAAVCDNRPNQVIKHWAHHKECLYGACSLLVVFSPVLCVLSPLPGREKVALLHQATRFLTLLARQAGHSSELWILGGGRMEPAKLFLLRRHTC